MKVSPQRTQWIGMDPTAIPPRVACKTNNGTSFDQIDPEKESLRRGRIAPNPTLLSSAQHSDQSPLVTLPAVLLRIACSPINSL